MTSIQKIRKRAHKRMGPFPGSISAAVLDCIRSGINDRACMAERVGATLQQVEWALFKLAMRKKIAQVRTIPTGGRGRPIKVYGLPPPAKENPLIGASSVFRPILEPA